jgi:hypothetical protein
MSPVTPSSNTVRALKLALYHSKSSLIVFFLLSGHGSLVGPVLAVFPSSHVVKILHWQVLSWQSCGSPALTFLCWQPCSGSPAIAVLY